MSMYLTFHDWIETNLKIKSSILEFGSGPGSNRLSSKFKMFSIEHDINWINKYENINYLHAPILGGWYDVKVICDFLQKGVKYDLVLVDGPTGKIGRMGLLKNLSLFDVSVPWIFDDVNRKKEFEIMKFFSDTFSKKYEVFEGENRNFAVVI